MREEFKEKIFENFLNNREIILNNKIEKEIIELVVLQIFKINKEDDEKENTTKNYNRNEYPIKIYINSIGGFTIECLSVISAIESSKTPVYTITLGEACSAAFMIHIAGHKRFCQKYSNFMYHQLGYSKYYDKLEEHKQRIDFAENIQKIIIEIVLNKTEITKEKLQEVHEKKLDWYILPKEAIRLGIVDEII